VYIFLSLYFIFSPSFFFVIFFLHFSYLRMMARRNLLRTVSRLLVFS